MLNLVTSFFLAAQVSGATDFPTLTPTFGPTNARSSSYGIQLFAGTGAVESAGTGGLATAASFLNPRSVWLDTVGRVYVSENSNCFRIIDATNIVQNFAGICGGSGYSGDGGPATSALIHSPVSMFISSVGMLYFSDYANNVVRSVSAVSIMSTVAGTGGSSYTGDGGMATSAEIYTPHALWCNSNGVMYVGSYSNNMIRAISTSGIITLFAGIEHFLIYTLSDLCIIAQVL